MDNEDVARAEAPGQRPAADGPAGFERLTSVDPDAPGDVFGGALALLSASLGVDAVCLGRLVGETLVIERAAGRTGMGQCAGTAMPVCDTYLQFMPWCAGGALVIADVLSEARFAALAMTRQLGVGAFSGIPLLLPDGSVYGALFTLHTCARAIQPDEAISLALAGRIIVQSIEAARETELLREAKLLIESEYLLLHDVAAVADRLRAAYDLVACGVVVQDETGAVIYANHAAEVILGLTFARMQQSASEGERWRAGREDGAALPDDALPTTRALRSGRPQRNVTMSITLPSGERRWIQVDAVPVAEEGEPVQVISSFTDITERVQAVETLRQSEERFRKLIESAPIGACIVDERGIYETVNAAYGAILGYAPGELIGRHIEIVFPMDVRARVADAYSQDIGLAHESSHEHAVVTKPGTELTVLSNTVTIMGADGRPRKASFCIDITDRKRAELHLAHLAHHDKLTGLPNRALFHDRLAEAIAHARQLEHVLALMFLDLDGFKAINDTLGHDAGDLLLQQVARLLQQCTRESDTVARLAGDEFTIILPSVGSVENAEAVARKILAAFAAGFVLDGRAATAGASIGISLYPRDGTDADALLKCADAAMYRAKKGGKNAYRVFDPARAADGAGHPLGEANPAA